MGYETPADVWISASWADHRARTPPSGEPGTDYATNYGTDLRMAGDGVVSVVVHSNEGGAGRRLSVDLDDGRRVSYLHLSEIFVGVGHRVSRGQTGIVRSGASGFGSDWGYGSHVHVSLWDRPGMSYADTIDFEIYAGPNEEDDMTPEQAESLEECRRMLGVMLGWTGAATDAEAGAVQKVWGEGETTSEARRMLGVMLGWNAPDSENERQSLAKLWETEEPEKSHPLITPAWVGGFFLGLIGLVEVVRFVVDLVA